MRNPTCESVPSVSIGFPVFNNSKYIKNALDTILNQSFKDFELIISDNASTDDTPKICQSYAEKDSRIKYFRQEKNFGAIQNFKFVLEKSSSSYFLWAASDDLRNDQWLECCYETLKSNPDAAIAYGSTQAIDNNGKEIDHFMNRGKFSICGSSFWRRIFFWNLFEGTGKAVVIYGIFNTNLTPLNRYLELCVQGKIYHDLTILFSVLKDGNFVYAKNALLYKRVHSESEESKLIGNRTLLMKIFWPFPRRLFSDYYKNSNLFEKLVQIIFFPIKITIAYISRVKLFYHISK